MPITLPLLEYVIDRTHSFGNIETDKGTEELGRVKAGSAFFLSIPIYGMLHIWWKCLISADMFEIVNEAIVVHPLFQG
jgi:hypothetical protein